MASKKIIELSNQTKQIHTNTINHFEELVFEEVAFIPAPNDALDAPLDEPKLTDTPAKHDPEVLADVDVELPEVLAPVPKVTVVEDAYPFPLIW